MVKLVIGTTILIVLVLGLSGLFQSRLYMLTQLGTEWTLIGIAQPMLLTIIRSVDVTMNVVLFVGGMITMIHYSHLDIALGSLSLSQQSQQVLLVPLAIISIIVGMAVAVLGVDVFDAQRLYTLSLTLTQSTDIQRVVRYMPFWVLLQ